LCFLLIKIQEHREKLHGLQSSTNSEFYVKQSDLFDYPVYIPEVCDVLNIALSELPAILTVQDIAEVLLHVKHGPIFVCWIVANFPDCFYDGMSFVTLIIFGYDFILFNVCSVYEFNSEF